MHTMQVKDTAQASDIMTRFSRSVNENEVFADGVLFQRGQLIITSIDYNYENRECQFTIETTGINGCLFRACLDWTEIGLKDTRTIAVKAVNK